MIITVATEVFRKDFENWEAVKLTVSKTSFPKFRFSLESSNFIYHWPKIFSVVSLEVTGSLCLFSRQRPSPHNQFACKPFFLVKMVFPEKSSYFNSQLHRTNTCL